MLLAMTVIMKVAGRSRGVIIMDSLITDHREPATDY
jgi:hypothetical protein